MVYLVIIAAGMLLAALNTWQRLGRTSRARDWSRGMRKEETSRNVLVLWPLIAVALVAGGLTGLVRDSMSVGASVLPALVFVGALVLWFAYLMFPLRVPRFVQPRWYHEGARREARR